MTDIRILIVEDEPLIAEDIAETLQNIGYHVAGIAYSSDKALDLLAIRQPDLALLDINIKGPQNGIDLGRIIHEKYKIPFLFLTSYGDRRTIDEAKKTMPYGYVLKPFSEAELLGALEIALYRFAHESKPGQPPNLEVVNKHACEPLSPREYEVLCDLCTGLNNKQIAEKLFVSENTIKTHVRQILAKLDAPNRSSAVHKVAGMR